MQSDREALLQTILDHPEDDVARLVFADWLEENNYPERAEGIREQIAHRLTLQCHGDWTVGLECDIDRPHNMCGLCRWLYYYCDYPGNMLGESETGNDRYQLHRGFISQVKCRVDEWFEYGEDICRQQPILRVLIASKEPERLYRANRWRWERSPS